MGWQDSTVGSRPIGSVALERNHPVWVTFDGFWPLRWQWNPEIPSTKPFKISDIWDKYYTNVTITFQEIYNRQLSTTLKNGGHIFGATGPIGQKFGMGHWRKFVITFQSFTHCIRRHHTMSFGLMNHEPRNSNVY